MATLAPSRHARVRIAAAGLCLAATSVFAQTDSAPGVRAIDAAKGRAVDFAKAKPRKLPENSGFSLETLRKELAASLEKDGSIEGEIPTSRSNPGSGKPDTNPTRVETSAAPAWTNREQWGTANLPFSTARADLGDMATNKMWPYRAAGKLFFVDGNDTFVCSASMIDRGLAVTAAHCVSEYGKNRHFSDFRFIPGYRKGEAPFGVWKVSKAYVLSGYPDGTSPCTQGAVCRDDVAVLALAPQLDGNKSYYAGERTGWYSYAYGKAPYTKSGVTHFTQIGYPVCLDDGELMERNDAQGAISPSNRDNTVSGSLMCGGSSGGPWIVNLGSEPDLTDTVPGVFAKANVVIGVTSWGAVDKRVKQQGASPFMASNIDFLVRAACKEFPDTCAQ